MADLHADEVTKTLHSYGWLVRTDPTQKYATAGENGRADLLATRGGYGVAIEIKSDYGAFSFDNWRDNQRKWWQDECIPYGTPLFIWLFLGKDRPNADMSKGYLPRRAWCVPAAEILHAESLIQPYQSSIPYLASAGYRTELQSQQLDAYHLFAPYEVKWAGGGTWSFPELHIFHKLFIASSPIEIPNQRTCNYASV